MRAGAQLLLMATDPLNRGILRTALERPVEVAPGEHYRVSAGGREVLFIAFVAERWLQSCPKGPISFDSPDAGSAIGALAGAWSTTAMHVLARGPIAFGDLHREVDGLGRRALKRQLEAMQGVGLIERREDHGEGAAYTVTDWLSRGLAPLITSARMERRNPAEGTAPIDALDVDAAFRLTLPMLDLPRELSGTCRLGVNLDEDESSCLTGVTAIVEEGRIASYTTDLDTPADAWAAASAGAWLDTVIEPGAKGVRTGGDRWLTRALLDSLHRVLFGVSVI